MKEKNSINAKYYFKNAQKLFKIFIFGENSIICNA
ncbi:hypothetical protein SAMN05444405_101213 [Bacteroides luti]|uniref:Uncharacterized protein n=1 Tax=Bacteroides luti TaxID=1297750 RepID=A0A1M4SWB0_9BACE|nr:hypothetical protein SAMN05444405_101213 [Bacteroides luti]